MNYQILGWLFLIAGITYMWTLIYIFEGWWINFITIPLAFAIGWITIDITQLNQRFK